MAAAAADMVDNISSTPIGAGGSSQYNFSGSPESHQPRQPVKSASSPWSQVAPRESYPIVASPSLETAIASSSSSASSSSAGEEVGPEPGTHGSTGKKAPWSRPSGGPGHEAAGPVIEADSWPALSASVKTSRKSSLESAKASSDASSSVSASQGTGIASSSPSHPSSHRQLNSHVDAQSNVNNPVPARQKSMRRNNANTPSNGDAPQSPGLRNPSLHLQSSNSSPGGDSQRSGSFSEHHGGNEHQQPQRNSLRNRSGGTYQRGDGFHSQNYGNRRGQARTNPEWNHNHGFNHSREARVQQQRGYPRYGRAPHPTAPVARPASAPFLAFPQPQHFGGLPIEMPHQVYYVPAPHPMNFVSPFYFPPPEPTLHEKIVDQVNYYFSNENLVKDTYLRRNMDAQGWVPVTLIASFNRILSLTNNIQLILDAVRTSSVVEVQGDRLRRRSEWEKWIMTSANQFPDAMGIRSSGDSLAASVQTLSLDERAGNGEAGKAEADASDDSATGTSN